LHPYPFELIGIHGFLLLCKIALSSPILTDADDYGEKTGSGLVKIAQVARN